jgi:hypothetical protein
MVLVFFGLTPIAALAAECGNYPLSQAQMDHLAGQGLDVPEGNVGVIQRCDTNGDNLVDITDIRAISMKRNQPAAHPDDPMDWDRNSVINVLDARGCQQACSAPRCAIQTGEPEPEEMQGGVTEAAPCYQQDDFDGDGQPDLVAIYEPTDKVEKDGDWTLQVVILKEDEAGNVEQITYPYSGQNSDKTGELRQHLSKQPIGPVDLNPGSLILDKPGIVSYRNGIPKVIYYFKDGEARRAYFGIDD